MSSDVEFIGWMTVFNLFLVGISMWESRKQARIVLEISRTLREDNERLLVALKARELA